MLSFFYLAFMFLPPQLLESDTSAPEKRSHSQRRVPLQVLRQVRTLCGRSRCCAGRPGGLHQRWGENGVKYPESVQSSLKLCRLCPFRWLASLSIVCYSVERCSAEFQWLLNMVQNDPSHYVRWANCLWRRCREQLLRDLLNLWKPNLNFPSCFLAFMSCLFPIRHKILGMLCKNPPFTKNTDSTLCNEALVDQLWKLMNSGRGVNFWLKIKFSFLFKVDHILTYYDFN